jgi:hypothetical protein
LFCGRGHDVPKDSSETTVGHRLDGRRKVFFTTKDMREHDVDGAIKNEAALESHVCAKYAQTWGTRRSLERPSLSWKRRSRLERPLRRRGPSTAFGCRLTALRMTKWREEKSPG